jgi:hypothetical protein
MGSTVRTEPPPDEEGEPMRNLKTVGAIAAGALAATALTGVAVATTAIADDETTTSEGTTETDEADAGERKPREHGGFGGMKGLAGKALGTGMGMLHGEVVVENSDGDYVTQQVQRGEVTSVSDTSITVVSEDGFEATYGIDSDTDQKRDREEGSAQVGDTVHVVGVVEASSTTAQLVMAMSPEAAAQFEEKLESMKDWMSQRPEGFGPRDGMRGWGGRNSTEGTAAPSLAG